MKTFDVINEEDLVIGTASAEECHSNPKLIHRVVHFTLVDQSSKRILISRRAYNLKFDPGKLCFMGEHVLSGQTYEDALKKGVVDELGFVPKKFKERGNHVFSYDKQREFARFFVIFWRGEEINYDEKEIVALEWLGLKDLLRRKAEYSSITKYWVKNVDWELDVGLNR